MAFIRGQRDTDMVANLDFDKLEVDFANKHLRRMPLPCNFTHKFLQSL